jgi:transcriptional regulator with XRE-family HTH domain
LTEPLPFGQALRRIRTERGLSLHDLAELANYSKEYLSGIENGQRVPPAG